MTDRVKRIADHLKIIDHGKQEQLQNNLTRSPFLTGGFEPVRKELDSYEALCSFGKIPGDLDGCYYKNGPNSYFDPPEDAPYHWFDGDGMVHAIDIKKGTATYSNKFVNSQRLELDKKRGYSIYNMGALNAGDLSKTLDDRVMDPETEETDLPYHLSTTGLETVGKYTFHGKINHAVTAHPKIDAETGEMFLFGHEVHPDPNKAFVSYSVIKKDGTVRLTTRIPLPGSRFMHDMGLTKKYVIFIDLPAVFDFQTEGTPWTFHKEMPIRFGIFPRYSVDPNQIYWFECKTGMIFHTINSFEEGEEKIIMQCCRADSYTMSFNASNDSKNWLFPYQWTLNLKSKIVTEQQLCNVRCDFPSINLKMVGKRQRYSYYSTYRPREGDNVPLYDGLVKLDHQSNSPPVIISLPSHLSCGEFSFVPKKNPLSEDDGYLVTLVFNENTNLSDFVVFDAKNLRNNAGEKNIICKITLPQRVPYGFHGCWISREELEQSINC